MNKWETLHKAGKRNGQAAESASPKKPSTLIEELAKLTVAKNGGANLSSALVANNGGAATANAIGTAKKGSGSTTTATTAASPSKAKTATTAKPEAKEAEPTPAAATLSPKRVPIKDADSAEARRDAEKESAENWESARMRSGSFGTIKNLSSSFDNLATLNDAQVFDSAATVA